MNSVYSVEEDIPSLEVCVELTRGDTDRLIEVQVGSQSGSAEGIC